MFHLVNKYGNVHKKVESKRKRDELIAAGYRLAEEPEQGTTEPEQDAEPEQGTTEPEQGTTEPEQDAEPTKSGKKNKKTEKE